MFRIYWDLCCTIKLLHHKWILECKTLSHTKFTIFFLIRYDTHVFPIALQTVIASDQPNPFLQTAPHCPFHWTSTRPSSGLGPPTSLTGIPDRSPEEEAFLKHYHVIKRDFKRLILEGHQVHDGNRAKKPQSKKVQ